VGVIKGICISEKRGTAKHEIEEAVFVKDWGIEKDAHAGHWHRQVSLLSYEKIEEFRKKGAQIGLGAFGENLIVEGYDFRNLPVGTRFQCGDVILEMTQIGKECHSHCEIYKRMGECIMPREGVFAVVIQGGKIKKGDLLMTFNLNGIKKQGYKMITPIVVCNADEFAEFKTVADGDVNVGDDVIRMVR